MLPIVDSYRLDSLGTLRPALKAQVAYLGNDHRKQQLGSGEVRQGKEDDI